MREKTKLRTALKGVQRWLTHSPLSVGECDVNLVEPEWGPWWYPGNSRTDFPEWHSHEEETLLVGWNITVVAGIQPVYTPRWCHPALSETLCLGWRIVVLSIGFIIPRGTDSTEHTVGSPLLKAARLINWFTYSHTSCIQPQGCPRVLPPTHARRAYNQSIDSFRWSESANKIAVYQRYHFKSASCSGTQGRTFCLLKLMRPQRHSIYGFWCPHTFPDFLCFCVHLLLNYFRSKNRI